MRKGFTLIELLVVIAIIAILAAILFPVFGKAREKARQTHCTNNQKSFATAVQIYTQEHEETLPVVETFWGDIRVDNAALKCMTVPSLANGYVMNPQISGKGLGEVRSPLTNAVRDASKVFLTADGKREPSKIDAAYPDVNVAYYLADIAYRHNDKEIASYLDGHVEMKTRVAFEAEWEYSEPATSTFDNTPQTYVALTQQTFVMNTPCDWTISLAPGVTDVAVADVTLNPADGKNTNQCTFTFAKSSTAIPAYIIKANPVKTGVADIDKPVSVDPAFDLFTITPMTLEKNTVTSNFATPINVQLDGAGVLNWAYFNSTSAAPIQMNTSGAMFSAPVLTGDQQTIINNNMYNFNAPGVANQKNMINSRNTGNSITFTLDVPDSGKRTLTLYVGSAIQYSTNADCIQVITADLLDSGGATLKTQTATMTNTFAPPPDTAYRCGRGTWNITYIGGPGVKLRIKLTATGGTNKYLQLGGAKVVAAP